MDRINASNKFKWNLTDIYPTIDLWNKDFEWLNDNCDKFSTFKGKLNDKKILKEYNDFSRDYIDKLEKVFLYTFLNHDVDLKNSVYLEQRSMIENLETKLSSITAYVSPELASYSNEYLQELINDEDFKNHKMEYQSIIDNKKHILSEKEENIMSLMSSFSSGFSNIFDSLTESDMKFDPIIVNGKEEKLTEEKLSLYLTNSDREVRRQAFKNIYKTYGQFAFTISNAYIYNVKMNSFDLKLRNYNSLLQASLEGNKIPESVYYNLIKNVSNNVNLLHKYYEIMKKKLNLEDFSFYDTYVSLFDEPKIKYDVETQFETIKKALSVLGEDYVDNLDFALSQHWIDAYSDDNKAGGGYNIAVYNSHPYILLNDNENYNSMSTMAHELGHAMHSFYSNANQPSELASYSIFVAEVASTVNEILLSKYMIKNAKTEEEKFYYIDQYIKTIKGTVFRQTMFSEFEDFAHKLCENNQPLSQKILDDKYLELNHKYFGDAVKIDESLKHEWLRISHFYRPYYVYKYATSFTVACYIVNSILNNEPNALENYKTLLKSGGNDWPNEILKKVGVDLSTDAPYISMFEDLENLIKEVDK